MKSIFVLLFVLGALFPLAWLVISGFKSRTEVVRTPFQFLPEVWRWENYAQILSDPAFLQAVFISLAGALIFAALSLIVNSLAAYVFARLEFRFKRILWVIVIGTMLLPGMSILLTSFIVVSRLGMLDTLWVLIPPGAASAAQIFFLRQFYLPCRGRSRSRRRSTVRVAFGSSCRSSSRCPSPCSWSSP